MSNTRMLRWAALAVLLAYWLAMFVGTHLPHGLRQLGQGKDKWMHFGAYAGLAFLLAAVLTSFRPWHGALLLTLAVAALYGAFDELTQIPIPGRQADLVDWVADVFGAGIGIAAFAVTVIAICRLGGRKTRATQQTAQVVAE